MLIQLFFSDCSLFGDLIICLCGGTCEYIITKPSECKVLDCFLISILIAHQSTWRQSGKMEHLLIPLVSVSTVFPRSSAFLMETCIALSSLLHDMTMLDWCLWKIFYLFTSLSLDVCYLRWEVNLLNQPWAYFVQERNIWHDLNFLSKILNAFYVANTGLTKGILSNCNR